MSVDLSPVEDLDIDQEVLEFVTDTYCANCVHFTTHGPDEGSPYCTRWSEPTEVKPGWVCGEYRPQGMGEADEE